MFFTLFVVQYSAFRFERSYHELCNFCNYIPVFCFSACNGTMNDLSVAALTSCKDAVTLCISLCGTICLWSGIMNVAGKSGIVSGLSRLLSKPLSLLFPDISSKGSAMQYIILNFISNLLGLGNASTPLGIKAMQELKEEQKAKRTLQGV